MPRSTDANDIKSAIGSATASTTGAPAIGASATSIGYASSVNSSSGMNFLAIKPDSITAIAATNIAANILLFSKSDEAMNFYFLFNANFVYLIKMKISFQGAKGAYSDLACRELYPDAQTIPCTSFDDAFDAVKNGDADLAVIPIDNTLAGRVADVHHLLPTSGLHIIGEHFLPIHHCLLGVRGAIIESVTDVHSHVHAIPQCRKFIRDNGLIPHVHADTAGAAAEIGSRGDKTQCAISSKLAAEIYGLDILVEGVEDDKTNKTRFIILSPNMVAASGDNIMTSFVFEVRNIPAALYKAMGGFATNGVNMMKLESYVDHKFNAARFYCEISGHADDDNVTLAFEELSFVAKDIKVLGSFEKSALRDGF